MTLLEAVLGNEVAFPPRHPYLLLPGRPRRALLNGLSLYESLEIHQRLIVRAFRTIPYTRFGAAPRSRRPTVALDPTWWADWYEETVLPLVGPRPLVALSVTGDRTDALFMERSGRPQLFAQLRPAVGSRQETVYATPFLEALRTNVPRSFSVPQVLARGERAGIRFRLFEPVPEGLSSRPRLGPKEISGVVGEFQSLLLGGLSRPEDHPKGHVPNHGDFTPWNLRRIGGNGLWLFDWESAGWGPRLVDELRYWTADLSFRVRVNVPRAAARIVTILRRHGTDIEIREALEWPAGMKDSEAAIRKAIAELVSA